MSSQVFYRKWRPQLLGEVVGQEHITHTLRNALMQGHVAHAYLFCGSRGTGKTSTGRILAKAVNCLSPAEGEPCGSCAMCQAISKGQCMDVIEIDAASNRGIDDIRELRERINFAPTSAKYKVYIVDEVHMLTDAASNALLKTLEEPPPHAIFILATTEAHRLLATILSRCQRFDFRRLSQAAIASKLNHICQEEALQIEDAAMKLIAKSVSGSLRDAENLLEQLATYYGRQITLAQVEDMLGITTDARVKELVSHIIHKDIAAGLGTINSVARDGLDLRQFSQSVLGYLRNIMLVKSGAEETLDLSPEDLGEVKALASKVSMESAVRTTRLFSEVGFQFDQYSTLSLELALVESAQPKKDGTPTPTKAGQEATPSDQEEPVSFGVPAATSSAFDSKEIAVEPEAAAATDTKESKNTKDIDFITPAATFEYVQAHWKDFTRSLKGMGPRGTLDAFLRSSKPQEIEGDTLVLCFDSSFHKDMVDKPECRRLVEERLKDTFGTLNKIRCSVKPTAKEGHLIKAAQQMGAIIVNREKRDG